MQRLSPFQFVSLRFNTFSSVGCVRMNAFACVCIRQDESYVPENSKQTWQKQIFASVRFAAFINRKSSQNIRYNA